MGLNSSAKIKWKTTGLTVKSVQDLNLGRRIDVDGNALTTLQAKEKETSLNEVAAVNITFQGVIIYIPRPKIKKVK